MTATETFGFRKSPTDGYSAKFNTARIPGDEPGVTR